MSTVRNETINDQRTSQQQEHCDVLIVGGGPAGSTCARQLIHAGYDVTILDRADFPRPKTCGGWMTPEVAEELEIPLSEYGTRFELQPIKGFRTGIVGDSKTIETSYERTVSYGIRRIEFDDYLLRRSGARLILGEAIDSLQRSNDGWIVNDRYLASLLIGAGGHFCPVARHLNAARKDSEHVVRAQEAEFLMTDDQIELCRVQPETPELYFFPDLQGYAWCFRKHNYLNIGLGGMGYQQIAAKKDEYLAFLRETERVRFEITAHFKGHAYYLQGFGSRNIVDERVLLIGDAAGLAYPQSGEGIRPAVESGIIAAQTILECAGDYRRQSLNRYQSLLDERFGQPSRWRAWERFPLRLKSFAARRLMRSRWFTRKVLIDRWFLHSDKLPLCSSENQTAESSAM